MLAPQVYLYPHIILLLVISFDSFWITASPSQTITSPSPPTTFSIASPPPSPPTSPHILAQSKSVKPEEGKRVGFALPNADSGGTGVSAVVHRRAASEAMKEHMLKQAKAQHEMMRLGILDFL